MNKILYVVSRPLEINTSASVRNKAMIEGLIANGFSVDLLTTTPDKKHAAYDKSLSAEGAHTIRIPMNQTQKVTGLSRKNKLLSRLKSVAYKWISKHEVYDHLKFIATHTDYVDLDNNQYDYIISSSDPKSSHLFVKRLLECKAEKFNGKWIQIWGDPFLADITRTNANKQKIRAEEQKLLEAADYVFYVSKMTLEQQKKIYPTCAHKMRYMPIPYVKEKITASRSLENAGIIELAYCGDYDTSIRNLKPLYHAINQIDNAHLTVCGGSDAPLQSTEKVSVKGRVTYEVTCDVENSADILVFVANRSGTQIPGKVYQYTGTNKPVLFVLDGDKEALKEQFEAYDRFVFVENDIACITKGVREITQRQKEYAPLTAFSNEKVMKKLMHEVSRD